MNPKIKILQIKGIAVTSIKEFVQYYFKKEYDNWINALPEKSKEIITSDIINEKWYPIDIAAIEPIRKICELFFKNDLKKGSWKTGRYSAEKGLRDNNKPLLFATSTSYVIEHGKKVFEEYYRPSQINIEKTDITNVKLVITNYIKDEIFEYRMAGWLERATELAGGVNPKVEITKSFLKGDDILEYDLKWG